MSTAARLETTLSPCRAAVIAQMLLGAPAYYNPKHWLSVVIIDNTISSNITHER